MISPLLTDLYQLTMAYGYWKLGMHERQAVFHLIFRKFPFQSNYALMCGLASVIDFLETWHFSEEDLDYLRTLYTKEGTPLFSPDFLDYLSQLKFSCDIDAIPDGTVIFPDEPLLRVTGPILQGQLIESTLLNLVNFQTLIATKAARVRQAAKGDTLLEFGLRRAQGPDGALSASRAAYIGGCDATSNVLAGKLYDIPVRGTHAHSWVTAFSDEIEAFESYATVMPHNCVLLVDTFDTLKGVKNAISVGRKLIQKNAKLSGIRLDSGDLATLSVKARQLLDEAGFTDTRIIASNSLDEFVIEELKKQGAPIDTWGVGTNLVTAYDHPALDGVYKLSAIQDEEGKWIYKLKLSEQVEKVSNPGVLQIRRYFLDDCFALDLIYDTELSVPEEPELVSLKEPHACIKVGSHDAAVDLLEPIFSKGKLVYKQKSIHTIREDAFQQVNLFLRGNKNENYTVGLEKNLHDLKKKLIQDLKKDLL